MQTEQEKANVELVNRFCADWSKKDATLLTEYLADDIVYQMFEGQPDIVGKEAFIKTLDGFLNGLVEVDWEMVRSYAIGDMVMNERVDHFVAETEDRRCISISLAFFVFAMEKFRFGVILACPVARPLWVQLLVSPSSL